jgi:hypothetical protein
MWYNEQMSGERMSKRMRQPLYVTDALAVGYTAIHRQPFILLFSIGLSVYLWLGRAIGLALPPNDVQGIVAQWLGTLHAIDARTLLLITNMIPFLAPGPAAMLPPPIYLPVAQFVSAVVILNLIALSLSSSFMVLLRQMLLNERPAWKITLIRSLTVAYRLAGLFGIVGGVLGPLLGLSVLIGFYIPATIPFIYNGWILLGIFGLIGFGLTPEIITLHNERPVAALRKSWQLARQRWFAIATFLAVCAVVEVGFAQIWHALATQPGWLALAIIGNAYIGSGLRAARLQFYRAHAATVALS